VANFTAIAAYTAFGLGIVNSGISLTNLLRSRKEKLRERQRDLRAQLRKTLREITAACDDFRRGKHSSLG
jgi:hypothetical protein